MEEALNSDAIKVKPVTEFILFLMAKSEYFAESLPGYVENETDLMIQVSQLTEYGEIDSAGNFIFKSCLRCKGPILGHKELTAKEIQQVVILLETNNFFEAKKNRIDTRYE